MLAAIASPNLLLAGEAPKKDEPGAVVVPVERLSPRATMYTFLAAMNDYRNGIDKEANLARAVATLDLEGAGLSNDLGPRYAEYLKDVLDRYWYVKMEDLPDAPQGTLFTKDLARNEVPFRLELKRHESGEWLFGAQMLKGLEALYTQVQDWTPVSAEIAATEAQNPGLWLEKHVVPKSLRQTTFVLKHWQWIGLLLLIGFGVLLDRVMGFVILRVVSRTLERRKIVISGDELKRVERPVGMAVMATLWWFGLQWLNLPSSVHDMISKVAVFFLAFSGVWAAYRLVDVLTAYLTQVAARTGTRMDDLLVPLVRKTLKIFVVVFGLVFLAGKLGLDIQAMLGGLAISGLAIALASKDTVENLFGSFTVLLERPFQIGDYVSIMGIEGTVEEVGFRSTRLRTAGNSVVTLPNSRLVSAHIENRGPRERRRISQVVVLKPAATPEQAAALRDALASYLRANGSTSHDHSQVFISELNGTNVRLQLTGALRAKSDELENTEREKLALEIHRLAREKGVEML